MVPLCVSVHALVAVTWRYAEFVPCLSQCMFNFAKDAAKCQGNFIVISCHYRSMLL